MEESKGARSRGEGEKCEVRICNQTAETPERSSMITEGDKMESREESTAWKQEAPGRGAGQPFT